MVAACKLKTLAGDRGKIILRLIINTGVRHQELTDLQVGDVDINTGQVVVKHDELENIMANIHSIPNASMSFT